MPCCLVGKHSQIDDIDAKLRAGDGVRSVARVYGLSKTGVAEHRRRCLRLDVAVGETANSGGSQASTERLSTDPAGLACRQRGGDLGQVSGQQQDSKKPGVEQESRAEEPFAVEVSGQVVEGCPDRATEEVVCQLCGQPNAARAIVVGNTVGEEFDPEVTGTYQTRVFHIADMMAEGKYTGRQTAKALAEQWKVTYEAVRVYARAAACVCKRDRGEIEQVREMSVGAWTDMRDKAREDGDWKAAAAAQAGLDRAAGVVEPGGPKVQINVMQDPGVRMVMQALRDKWQELHPHTLPEADAAVRAVLFGRSALVPK